MVEVFRTNVQHPGQATLLIDQIHQIFDAYKATFDLEDCDHILRVKCSTGTVESSAVIRLLNDSGFHAEILPDEADLVKFGAFGVGVRSDELHQ